MDKINYLEKYLPSNKRLRMCILMGADACGISYHFEYTDDDLLNAFMIFTHVAQNVAIKNGYYQNEDDIKQKMDAFKNGVKIGFDFDTVELTKKVLQ